MIDGHEQIGNGVLPEIGGLSTYSLLVGLGLLAGVLYIVWRNRQAGQAGPDGTRRTSQTLIIVAAALIGGTIGAKVPVLLQSPRLETLLFGKSVVGGLLGGTLSVFLAKRLGHIRLRLGNTIAPAAALGLAIGRLGCFCNGCCYGVPVSWGVDFGDGIRRLPTQLMEAGFQFTAFLILHVLHDRSKTPGILFKLYVIAYFAFRFGLEFVRVNPVFWLGLTIYQLLCLAGIIWMGLMLTLAGRRRRNKQPADNATDAHTR